MNALVEQLCARTDDEGCWSISPQEVARLLGMDPVSFWRALAEVRDRINFSAAIDSWTQDSVGDLVTVLERLVGGKAEEELTRAGLFLPYSLSIELAEEVMFGARRLAAGHQVREEEFAGMLRHAGGVRGAIGIYLNEYIDLEDLFSSSVDTFLALHGLPPRGKATALRALRTMLERHVLERKALLVGLEERLRLAAAQMGYVDPEDRPRDRGRREKETMPGRSSDRQVWARRVMGLDGRSYSAEDLRLVYRKLMMRHHPDVDPSGLERCKDVNAAYSILISEVSSIPRT